MRISPATSVNANNLKGQQSQNLTRITGHLPNCSDLLAVSVKNDHHSRSYKMKPQLTDAKRSMRAVVKATAASLTHKLIAHKYLTLSWLHYSPRQLAPTYLRPMCERSHEQDERRKAKRPRKGRVMCVMIISSEQLYNNRSDRAHIHEMEQSQVLKKHNDCQLLNLNVRLMAS